MVVGVGLVPGPHLGHPTEQGLFVVAQRIPGTDVVEIRPLVAVDAGRIDHRVHRGQLGAVRDDVAELLHPLERFLGVDVVAVVEHALVLVGPLLGRVVRGVPGAGGVVHEERLVGSDLLRVGDHADRTVREILAQVVPVFHRVRLVDRLVVLHQVRIPLVGLGAQEPVVPVEPAMGRPRPLRCRHAQLVGRSQVPLAERIGVPALLLEPLGDRGRVERDDPVAARETRGSLGDAGHRRPSCDCAPSASTPGSASTTRWCGTGCTATLSWRCGPCSAS